MSDLQKKIDELPAPKVTVEYIKSRIVSEHYTKFSDTVTVCEIKIDNGYSVRGESACVSPENYNKEIGQQLAQKAAFNKLWPLFGFLLAESLNHPSGNGFRDPAEG